MLGLAIPHSRRSRIVTVDSESSPRHHRRRRPGRQRSRLAGRVARRARRPPRDAAGEADRGPQDRRSGGTRLLATPSAATSSTTPSACSKRRCGGSGRSSCARADEARVPAGAALAVDRERFSCAGHGSDRLASADQHPPRRGHGDPVRGRRPGHHRDRSADVRCAVGRDRGAGRRRTSLFLRRDQPDRPGRVHRRYEGLPRLPLGPQPGTARGRSTVQPDCRSAPRLAAWTMGKGTISTARSRGTSTSASMTR